MSYDRGSRGRGQGNRGRGDGRRGGRGGGDRGSRGGTSGTAQNNPIPRVEELGRAQDPDPKSLQAETRILDANKKLQQLPGNFPPRPDFNLSGQALVLRANYFEMKFNSKTLHRYHLTFTLRNPPLNPDATLSNVNPQGKKLQRLVELFIRKYLTAHSDAIATDFAHTLWSVVKLRPLADEDQNKGLSVKYSVADNDQKPDDQRQTFSVELELQESFQVADLLAAITAGQRLNDRVPAWTQAFNIVISHHTKRRSLQDRSNMLVLNSKVFPDPHQHQHPSKVRRLGLGLNATRGFFTSVRLASGRALLNVQTKSLAIYPDKKLLEVFRDFESHRDRITLLDSYVRLLRVKLTHTETKQERSSTSKSSSVHPPSSTANSGHFTTFQVKAIAGLATPSDGRDSKAKTDKGSKRAPGSGADNEIDQARPPIVPHFGANPYEVQFWLPNGSGDEKKPKAPNAGAYISVAEYFHRRYPLPGFRQCERKPVMRFGSASRPTYIPADYLEIMPGQPARQKLNPTQLTSMHDFAGLNPHQGAATIERTGPQLLELRTTTSDDTNPTMASFGVKLIEGLISVPGRQLTGPHIRYQGVGPRPAQNGSWNMNGAKFASPADAASIGFVYIHHHQSSPGLIQARLSETAARLVDQIRRTGLNIRNAASEVQPLSDECLSGASAEQRLREFIARGQNALSQNALFFFILEREHTTWYNLIKRCADTGSPGFHSICMLRDKFLKESGQVQYLGNVALKANLKLNGRNSELHDTDMGILKEGKTMVVGLDVTHPSVGSHDDAPSIAGSVATIDRHAFQYRSCVFVQARRQESISDLDKMIDYHVTLWKNLHRTPPENILVYRDGVSEGQYQQVIDSELPLIRKGCTTHYRPPHSPKITILIVGKRHNTRFYPATPALGDPKGNQNPPAGTLVDRGITYPDAWDFFLQSHQGLKGTARPAHYFVAIDEIWAERRKGGPGGVSQALQQLTHHLCFLSARATRSLSVCPPAYYADLLCERVRRHRSGVFEQQVGADGQLVEAQAVATGRYELSGVARRSMFFL